MQRIKKGDEIIVISGRDKGKRGTVLRRVDDEHVVVEGVNRVKKHMRPNPMKGVTGGIIEQVLGRAQPAQRSTSGAAGSRARNNGGAAAEGRRRATSVTPSDA